MQKFNKGDLVRIAEDLGHSMMHFTADCDAVVMGSYSDKFGGSNSNSYTLYIKEQGETSWYDEHQLTLIEKNRLDIVEQWKKEQAEQDKLHGDLDWIFANGESILTEGATCATIKALAECLGIDDLWGEHGEGFVYYQRAITVLTMADPFLVKNDKAGWLAFADKECE